MVTRIVITAFDVIAGRLEDIKNRYPQADPGVIDGLAAQDPSGQNKYLAWMADQVLNLGGQSANVVNLVRRFHQQQARLPKQYRDISKLDVDTLEQVLTETEKVKTRSKTKKEVSSGYDVVAKTPLYTIYKIKSKPAACALGRGTKWCVTMADQDHYENYVDEGSQFFFVIQSDDTKYAVDVSSLDNAVDVYDSKDNRVLPEALPDGALSHIFRSFGLTSEQAVDLEREHAGIEDPEDAVFILLGNPYTSNKLLDAALQKLSDPVDTEIAAALAGRPTLTELQKDLILRSNSPNALERAVQRLDFGEERILQAVTRKSNIIAFAIHNKTVSMQKCLKAAIGAFGVKLVLKALRLSDPPEKALRWIEKNYERVSNSLGRRRGARTVRPTQQMVSEAGWLYHATNEENAHEIATTGLLTHEPWDFTDQDQWPDGRTEPRVYFTPRAGSAWQFAPESGIPVLLRVPQTFKQGSDGTGDVFSRVPVPASAIQILTDDPTTPWMPIATWSTTPNEQPRDDDTGGVPGDGVPPIVVGGTRYAQVAQTAVNYDVQSYASGIYKVVATAADGSQVGQIMVRPLAATALTEDCAQAVQRSGNKQPFEVVLSFVDEAYQNQGIGSRLYQWAVYAASQTGGVLVPNQCESKGETSSDAQRRWERLQQQYGTPGPGYAVSMSPEQVQTWPKSADVNIVDKDEAKPVPLRSNPTPDLAWPMVEPIDGATAGEVTVNADYIHNLVDFERQTNVPSPLSTYRDLNERYDSDNQFESPRDRMGVLRQHNRSVEFGNDEVLTVVAAKHTCLEQRVDRTAGSRTFGFNKHHTLQDLVGGRPGMVKQKLNDARGHIHVETNLICVGTKGNHVRRALLSEVEILQALERGMGPGLDPTNQNDALMILNNALDTTAQPGGQPAGWNPAITDDVDELMEAVRRNTPGQWAEAVYGLVERNPGIAPRVEQSTATNITQQRLPTPTPANTPTQQATPPPLPQLRAAPIGDGQGGYVWARPGARVVVHDSVLDAAGITGGSPIGTIEAVDVDGTIWVAADSAPEDSPAIEVPNNAVYLSRQNAMYLAPASAEDFTGW